MALSSKILRHRVTKATVAIAMLASLTACGVLDEDITADWSADRLYQEARSAADVHVLHK